MSLRAQTSSGHVYDALSEDLLHDLISELGVEDYVIVERTSDPSGQTYAQILRTQERYLIERRDGSDEAHSHAWTTEARDAHADLATWAFGLERPDVLAWHPGQG